MTTVAISIQTTKATRPKQVENDASATPPKLILTSCDLDFWPPNPQSWSCHVLAWRPIYQFALKLVLRFQNIMFTTLVTDKRMNRRTNRQVRTIMLPASLESSTHKNTTISLKWTVQCNFKNAQEIVNSIHITVLQNTKHMQPLC